MKTALALMLLVGTGCLVGPVDGIPCSADSECPTTYFCDLPNQACVAEAPGVGVPDLNVDKVRDSSGAFVLLPRMPSATTADLGLSVKNTGAGSASGIGITFAKQACVSFEGPSTDFPVTLAPGKSTEVVVQVTTGDATCAGVKFVDWFLSFDDRESRGAFDIDIEDAATP